ncbi:hypothetical protein PS652_00461 [Pseudomonas fluorescens]|uniref:Uncharacterized protein n=1 Tax=Pseudomonas fluorescens TaxID=294 RepID=A0A5E6Q441_PSEFL|nr:hypothetical protein PS652_00774 [Pseudomonas fluorescens]
MRLKQNRYRGASPLLQRTPQPPNKKGHPKVAQKN